MGPVRDRAWFSAAALVSWVLVAVTLFFGGALGWFALAAYCEDYDGVGSDRFCRRGGWETSGLLFAALFVAALVVPAVGLVAKRKRVYWAGLAGPLALALLNFFLWSVYGRA